MHFSVPNTSLRAQVLEEFRARSTPWGCVATVPEERPAPECDDPPVAPPPPKRRRIVSC